MCACNDFVSPQPAEFSAQAESLPDEPLVRVRYDGLSVPVARHTVIGAATKRQYGRREKGEVFLVYQSDITPDRFTRV